MIGTQDVRNWITNLDAFKTAYTTYPECNCQVHKGFYEAALSVSSGIIAEVKRLHLKHPSYAIKVTGHSLGAALAQLTAMEIKKAGLTVAEVYNFGKLLPYQSSLMNI